MTENTNDQLQPPPPPPPVPPQVPEDGAQRAKSGGKVLKIVAAVLAVLFLLLAGTAFYIYRRVTMARAALAEALNASPNPFPQAGLPEGAAAPGQGFALFQQGGQQSSLNLVGSVPGGGAPAITMSPEQAERIHKAFMKYADRPIVKDFIADMKKNPDMAKALDQAQGGGNPIAVMGAIRNAKGMEALAAKYAVRPEFLSLLMEVMKDPEIKPFLAGVPGGMPAMPGPGQPPQAPAPAGGTVMPDAASSAGGDSPMTVNTSAISGTPAPESNPPARRGVPPPVDSE